MKRRSRLDADESAYLAEHFGLSTGGSAETAEREPQPGQEQKTFVLAADLLGKDACIAYLDFMVESKQAPSRLVAASLFAKRYSFLSIGPVLFALSQFGKGLELPVGGSWLKPPAEGGGAWLPGLLVAAPEITEPEPGRREEWRRELLEQLFAGHIAPLWRTLHDVSRIPMVVLWENAAIRLFSLYEKRLAKENKAREQARIWEDFKEIAIHAPGRLFDERNNPIARFYTPLHHEQAVRVRKTCCLYYQVSSAASYCSTCPKTEAEQR